MMRYAARRLLQMIPVLFGISLIVFLLVRLIPGDPAIAVLGSRATPELVARVHDQLGLDLPLWQQYFHYLDNALHGDFGISFFYQTDVWGLTMARLPMTPVADGLLDRPGHRGRDPFCGARRRRAANGIADPRSASLSRSPSAFPAFWLGIILALVLGAKSQAPAHQRRGNRRHRHALASDFAGADDRYRPLADPGAHAYAAA